MKIQRLIGGNLESNGYVIYHKQGGDCYVIDPGYNPERFLKLLEKLELSLKGILLTHHHYDHVGGVEKIRKETGCKVYLHREDVDRYKKEVDVMLEDGSRTLLEDEEIRVLHTPGHTRGSVCFYSEQSRVVFTGDTVFDVDLGRTDLEDGDEEQMRSSIRNVVNRWDNGVVIYPGHGDSASMKYVREHNQEFLDCLK